MASFETLMEVHFKSKIGSFIFSRSFNCRKEFLNTRQYLQKRLPISYKDKLMNDLLIAYSGENYDKDIIRRILELLLSKDTRTLIIYPFKYRSRPKPPTYVQRFFGQFCPSLIYPFNDVIHLIKSYRPSLTHLEMYNEYMKYSDFEEILEFMPNLKTLKVKSYQLQNEDFLGTILKNCPLLEELVLVGVRLNLTTLDSWRPLINLRQFVFRVSGTIKAPKISSSDLIKIFRNFPNLEKLTLIVQIPNDLAFISKLPKNLREFKFPTTSFEEIEKIHFYFPKMETLILERTEIGLLNYLQNFKYLNNLTMYCCRPSEIYNLVSICGPQFKTLTLGVGGIDLNLLLERCPNLEKLILYLKNCLPGYDTWNVNMIHEHRDRKLVFHDNLKKFHLSCFPYINPTQFLRSLRGIEELSFNYLNTGNLTNIYQQLLPVWKNLRSLKIPRAPDFTANCVVDICNSCNQLEEILLPRHIHEKDVKKYIRKHINIINQDYNNFCFKIEIEHGNFSAN